MNIKEYSVELPQWGSASVFHPKITRLADGRLLMIVQQIFASDSFGVPRWSISDDEGQSWSKAVDIGSLAATPEDDLFNGVCDMVPLYHRHTGKVVVLGHNVYYRDNRFVKSHPGYQRYGVYTVGDGKGNWGARYRLEIPEFADSPRIATGCSQFLELADGDLLIPVSYSDGGDNRLVTMARFGFDGNRLQFKSRGNSLRNTNSRRGLMEPSLVSLKNKYFLTMRAEDGFGYLSSSDDGVDFTEPVRWSWEDGEPLTMSTTQQHWAVLNGNLYLVYTRDAGFNSKVVRYRSPMFVAQVDTEKMCLRRDTEQTVFTLHGDPEKPETVGMLGNFMVTQLDEKRSLVSDGEVFPGLGYDHKGALRMAYLEA